MEYEFPKPRGPMARAAKDELLLIAGAGGFIAGNLAAYFKEKGFTRIRAVDKKPLNEWYRVTPGVESLCLDLSDELNCRRAAEGAREVYNLAADMGGMGFIETHRVDCLRSVLINTHLIEESCKAGAVRYFYASSACAYNTDLQTDPHVRALKESDAYPAMAERGYGWEKLIWRCSARSTGPSAAWRHSLPVSTTSTVPTAPGTAAGKRRQRRSAAR